MYRVIIPFIDLQDGEHAYNIGDAFPREGHTVSEARINELSGTKNKRKMPLIAEEPDEAPKPKRFIKKEAKGDKSEPSDNAKSKSGKKKQLK